MPPQPDAGRIRFVQSRVATLEAAIRKHRDQRGDDRCWLDDEELYEVLPEGHTPPQRDSGVELRRCEQYIRCRHNPATAYVSPQRRIEQLEAENSGLRQRLQSLTGDVPPDADASGYGADVAPLRAECAAWREFMRAAVEAYPSATPMPQPVARWWAHYYQGVVAMCQPPEYWRDRHDAFVSATAGDR